MKQFFNGSEYGYAEYQGLRALVLSLVPSSRYVDVCKALVRLRDELWNDPGSRPRHVFVRNYHLGVELGLALEVFAPIVETVAFLAAPPSEDYVVIHCKPGLPLLVGTLIAQADVVMAD